MTRLDHAIQRGQIVAVLNCVLCCAQDDRGRVGIERFQPQSFDLIDLLSV